MTFVTLLIFYMSIRGQLDGVVWSSAWNSRRRSGQHDRDGTLRRSGDRDSDSFAVQRNARADEEMLADVDVLVFDMQDVGCRIYTFAYTMANCMRAAKAFNKKVVRLRSPESDQW